MPSLTELHNAYVNVKDTCKADFASKIAGTALLNLTVLSIRFLEQEGEFIDLISRVPGKAFVSYRRNRVVARPANKEFFIRDISRVSRLWEKWEDRAIVDSDIVAMSYTMALAPCLAMELFDRQNKKGPATYFECLIGHFFARTLRKNPEKNVSLPIQGQSIRMTMDFLFDLGSRRPKIHLPVKMSTRERVVQAWSHQRMLDSAYGEGTYKGIMVLFSETKMDSRSLEVIEICVPDQWIAYQSLLAKMEKIYYFDLPERYKKLSAKFPQVIQIHQFGECFNQINAIAA